MEVGTLDGWNHWIKDWGELRYRVEAVTTSVHRGISKRGRQALWASRFNATGSTQFYLWVILAKTWNLSSVMRLELASACRVYKRERKKLYSSFCFWDWWKYFIIKIFKLLKDVLHKNESELSYLRRQTQALSIFLREKISEGRELEWKECALKPQRLLHWRQQGSKWG